MYEQFFGLKDEPFRMTPDPRFLFLSKRHLEALSSLHYGVERKKGFIEITGDIGSGKTTICRSFLSQLKPTIKCALIFNPVLTEIQILQTILDDFGIKGKLKNRKEYFDAINRFLLEQNALGNTVVLIIDEAQNLSPKVLEQIRLLSNLETTTDKLIQIVFFGQPEFREVLKDPSLEQLRQRISVRYHLTALSVEETREYIYHRLIVAGAEEGSIVVTPKAISVVHEYTKGVPRLINSLCDKVLMVAFVHESRQITYQLVEEAIGELEGVVRPESTVQQQTVENLIKITL